MKKSILEFADFQQRYVLVVVELAWPRFVDIVLE